MLIGKAGTPDPAGGVTVMAPGLPEESVPSAGSKVRVPDPVTVVPPEPVTLHPHSLGVALSVMVIVSRCSVPRLSKTRIVNWVF
jgi:hypothetical protein